jgi:hypothetical protein
LARACGVAFDYIEQRGGKTPMQGHEQRTSNELVKLIRKLRWIGMEEEADTLAEELALRRATDSISVVAQPRDTD